MTMPERLAAMTDEELRGLVAASCVTLDYAFRGVPCGDVRTEAARLLAERGA